jgi:acyl dehydratase
MPIDQSLVGQSWKPIRRTWRSKDALLYALAVGAGQADALKELEFTSENSSDIQQRVLPTFVCLAPGGANTRMPRDLNWNMALHAQQAFVVNDELPVDADVLYSGSISGVYDKGSGALVTVTTKVLDSSGHELASIEGGMFLRGYGGFGGDRGPKTSWEKPTGRPEHEVSYDIPVNQALVYRLTGDRNPLHSDPVYSARAGFNRPILHGMCTYGYTGRALLHAVAGSDIKRFRGMSGRFTSPVIPGGRLTVSIWVDGPDVRFQTTDEAGRVAIDQGTATVV